MYIQSSLRGHNYTLEIAIERDTMVMRVPIRLDLVMQ